MKDLEKRLNDELDTCLAKEERALATQAATDAASLAPLLKETSAKAKELGGPQVKRYVALYGSAVVKCTNDLGERSRAVSVPAVAAMSAWLETPMSGSGVTGGTWTGPSGYTMMSVPAGTYEVGCTASQSDCKADEKPAHSVKLSHGTLMGKTEVTQGLWQSVMGSTPWTGNMYYGGSEQGPCKVAGVGVNLPAMCVSWVDAAKFANALSKRDGLNGCYTISEENVSWPRGLGCAGYRLPTEAEWEVAARGGRDTPYAGGAALEAVGWTSENSNSSAHPVGQKAANNYGLYDMTGNVWEWTWDWYGAYGSGTQVDPQGDTIGSYRFLRGGSWYLSATDARVAVRFRHDLVVRYNDLGFRLAKTIP